MAGNRVPGVERSGAEASLRSTRPARSPGGGLLGSLERMPRWLAQLASAALLVAVGVVDSLTGPELSFSIFYLLPVSLAGWRLGRAAGFAWAVLAAAVWLGIDLDGGVSAGLGIELWNGAVRLAFFLIVAGALAALRRLWDAERVLAGTDYLTGVLNARSFNELVELERSRALRYNRPFTLAYMDVDGFKRVNDELGHARGDEALRLIARTVRENVRSMDSVARLGGDEFALLFPETGPGAAEVALRKIQERLQEVMGVEQLGLSFSIGAVICLGPPESVERLIQRADALMYQVKREGRNGLRTEALDENFGIEAILRRS